MSILNIAYSPTIHVILTVAAVCSHPEGGAEDSRQELPKVGQFEFTTSRAAKGPKDHIDCKDPAICF